MFSVRKGVLWLLLATVAEVPPAVCSSLAFPLAHLLFAHRHVTSQVFIVLNLNGTVFSSTSTKDSGLNPMFCFKSQSHSISYVLDCHDAGNTLIPFTSQICQLPSVITMTIGATRMYRSLADFASSSTEMYQVTSYHLPLSVDDNPQKQ